MEQHPISRTWEVSAAALCAGATALVPLLPGSRLLGAAAALLPLALLLVLAVRHRMRWTATGAALLGVGNAIFHLVWWLHGTPVVPTVADVFFTLGYLALARGAWSAPGPGRAGAFDALLVVIGPAVVVVAFVAPPVLLNGPSLRGALTIAYPVLDLLLLLVVVRAVLAGAVTRVQGAALQAGCVLLVFGNSGFVALLAWAPGAMAPWMAAPFGLAWSLGALAVALHPRTWRQEPARPPDTPAGSRSKVVLVLLPASACLPSAALVAQGVAGWDVDWRVLGTGALLTALLSTVRLHRALRVAAEQASALERLALVDELTGLPNRRACSAALEELVAPGSGRLALALLDLDRFKVVNDTLGHAAGDALLREAARRWRAVVPPSARLHRWGGEEFVVLLSGADARSAGVVLQDLRLATPAPHTVSAGLVTRRPGEDATSLLARADALLYRAKEAGRDRVTSDTDTDAPQRGQHDDAGAPRWSAPAPPS